jgi:hypothetical protein
MLGIWRRQISRHCSTLRLYSGWGRPSRFALNLAVVPDLPLCNSFGSTSRVYHPQCIDRTNWRLLGTPYCRHVPAIRDDTVSSVVSLSSDCLLQALLPPDSKGAIMYSGCRFSRLSKLMLVRQRSDYTKYFHASIFAVCLSEMLRNSEPMVPDTVRSTLATFIRIRPYVKWWSHSHLSTWQNFLAFSTIPIKAHLIKS